VTTIASGPCGGAGDGSVSDVLRTNSGLRHQMLSWHPDKWRREVAHKAGWEMMWRAILTPSTISSVMGS
jgi:hypothetical protein